LGAELLLARPGRDAGERRRRVDRRRAGGEEPDLPRRALLGAARRPAHDVIEAGEEAGAVPLERGGSAALDEAVDHAPVDELAPDPEAEVRKAREGTLLARRDGRLDRLRADALHGTEPEADRVAGGGEVLAARVHIGRQDGDRPLAALGDV